MALHVTGATCVFGGKAKRAQIFAITLRLIAKNALRRGIAVPVLLIEKKAASGLKAVGQPHPTTAAHNNLIGSDNDRAISR